MKSNLSEKEKRVKLYATWSHLIDRCNNQKNSYYKNYGGRGISVCDRWMDITKIKNKSGPPTFQGFLNFFEDMNDSWTIERNTIDRINNDGNYDPSNCQWLSRSENTRKRNDESGNPWIGEFHIKERVKNGTHNFQDKHEASERNKRRITNNNHHLLGKGRDEHPGKKNKGKIAINNKIKETHIDLKDFPKYNSEGWEMGELPKIKKECYYCKRFFDPGNFTKSHGEKCKLNPTSILGKTSNGK